MPRYLLVLCLVFTSVLSHAQAFKIDPIKTDSNLYESPIKVVQSIQLVGNKITKDDIILRELLFAIGDTLQSTELLALLEQSKKNVLNTSLFNFCKIEWAMLDPSKIFVIVHVVERWYTFPVPIFEIDDNNFNTWWQDKDFSRINYGMHLVRNNFRGRKEKISLTAQFGFTEQFRLRYDIPYITRNKKSGMGFSFSYNRLDELTYLTKNNEREQFKSETQDAIKNYSAGIRYTYRPKIFNTHSLGLEYDENRILDSVRILNPEYLGQNRLRSAFLSIYYGFVHDNRDSKNYPLKGNYFSMSIQQYGLGILESENEFTNLNFNIKRYIPLSEKFFFASSLRAEIASSKRQPYLLQNGLGYSSSYGIRAYELYVIDGQNIALGKVQLRYQLVKPHVADLGFIRYEKISKFHYAFYLGLFSDFAYVEDNLNFPENRLANELLYSAGIGLDFISYYDVVIRTEFSVNKLGESGLFLHFVAPI